MVSFAYPTSLTGHLSPNAVGVASDDSRETEAAGKGVQSQPAEVAPSGKTFCSVGNVPCLPYVVRQPLATAGHQGHGTLETRLV
jgi:hypothetical protein